MRKYKFEVLSICDKCGYEGYDFKLYDLLEELQDGSYEETNNQVCVCPKCGFEDQVLAHIITMC